MVKGQVYVTFKLCQQNEKSFVPGSVDTLFQDVSSFVVTIFKQLKLAVKADTKKQCLAPFQ